MIILSNLCTLLTPLQHASFRFGLHIHTLIFMHYQHITYAIVSPSNQSCKYIVWLFVYIGVAPSFDIHLIVFLSSFALICLYEFVLIYTYLLFDIQSKCLIQNSLCNFLKNISTSFNFLLSKNYCFSFYLQNCKVFCWVIVPNSHFHANWTYYGYTKNHFIIFV